MFDYYPYVSIKTLSTQDFPLCAYIVKNLSGALILQKVTWESNASLVAHLHDTVYHLWKSSHSTFMVVGGVAHTRFSTICTFSKN